MRSRTSTWFETNVRYEKTQEDGSRKNVTELYAVDALSCKEAEDKTIEELKPFISGDFKVKSVKEAPYKEIHFSDLENDDKWFKAKLSFIILDEKTGKEKRSTVQYLVQSSTLPRTVKYIGEVMEGTAADYEINAIQETKVMDVFEHEDGE